MAAKVEGATPLLKQVDEFFAPCPDSGLETLWTLLFGIAAPAAVLILDVLWLPDSIVGRTGLLPFRPYSSATAWAAMAALAAWYPYRGRTGSWQALPAGAFAVGALLAGGIGLLLLPLSLFFSIAGIGLLGFVPLFTALVFVRSARRAWRGLRPVVPASRAGALSAFAAAAFAAIGVGAGLAASSVERTATAAILEGGREGTARAERTLGVLRWVPGIDMDPLWDAATGETPTPPEGRERAENAYRRITGRSPEEFID